MHLPPRWVSGENCAKLISSTLFQLPMKKESITVEVPAQTLHVEHARCPSGHSLMDPRKMISGYPALKVLLRYAGRRGYAHLDPVLGSFQNQSEIDIPDGEIVEMLCPTCQASLQTENETCSVCYAPMFAIYLPNGGTLKGCQRNGCHRHKLLLVEAAAQRETLKGGDHIQMLM